MRWQTLRDTLRADLRPDTERGQLIRSAGATVGLHASATLLAFGASLLYARVLGPHDYGLYAFIMAWVSIFTIPAGLGIPEYLVREGAKGNDHLRKLRRWGDVRVLCSGVAMAILMACVVFVPQAANARWLFVVAAPIPLLNSLGDIRTSLLHAYGWVARSFVPRFILSPALVLVGLAILWVWRNELRPIAVVAAMTAGASLPAIVNQIQLRYTHPQKAKATKTTVQLRAALPFMWLGIIHILNSRTDLVMLGALEGAHPVGVYSISSRVSGVVALFLVASNLVIAPRIARLHDQDDHTTLQRLLTGSVRRVAVLSLPIVLLFVVVASPLLGYLYGREYASGAHVLQILTVAQLINVCAGPTALLLNMTGHEKLTASAVGLSVGLNIILNVILIPILGIEGAAIATGASLVTWNLLLTHWIHRHLSLRASAIGI